MHRIILTGSLALFLLPLTAFGQEPASDDHDRAEAAVASGAALPLARILDDVLTRFPGRLIEVELDGEDGRLVYEIELVTTDGRLIEIELDAATGAILDVEEDD